MRGRYMYFIFEFWFLSGTWSHLWFAEVRELSTVVLYCWCHSNSASVLFYFKFLFTPLPCGACSTVPREGFDSSVIMHFHCVLWLWHFLYSVGPRLHIYPLLCRGHSWRVRLAKQETLTPPGHLVSPLVCRGPWNGQRSTLLLVPQWQCISSFVFYTQLMKPFKWLLLICKHHF